MMGIARQPPESRFRDASVAKHYHLRPSYPLETFHILLGLITDQPSKILDIGCGTGDIARFIAAQVEQIDAVDYSLPMMQHGKTLEGGDAANIHWIHESAEAFTGQGPYSLITAGQSLHWMQWETVLPKLSEILTPNGVLSITTVLFEPKPPWQDGYVAVIKMYSNSPEYRSMEITKELENVGLFKASGTYRTAPVLTKQTISDYINSQHGRSGLSLETMTPTDAEIFKEDSHSRQIQTRMVSYI